MGNWGLVRNLQGAGSEDRFGASVALSSDILVAGATDTSEVTPGQVRAHSRDLGGADNWDELTTLSPYDGSAGDRFGYATDMDGTTVVVGTPFRNWDFGSAYIFELPPASPCYPLVLAHTGSGADPVATPSASAGCSTGFYKEAEAVTLTAAPDAGWVVDNWSGTDNDVSTSSVNTVTMPASEHAASVAYAVSPCFSLTLGHSGSGGDPSPSPASSPGCPAGAFHAGELVTLTAAPDAGWVVGNWSGTDNDGSTSSFNTATMPATNHTVTVNYSASPLIFANGFE